MDGSNAKQASSSLPRERKSAVSPEKARKNNDLEASFRLLSVVVKKEVPSIQEMQKCHDPVAAQLKLLDRTVTGKNFALFDTAGTRKVVHGRWIVFVGDSVIRAMYKDIVHMINDAKSLVYPYDLARKGEFSFQGDKLVHGFRLRGADPDNGIDYEEVRTFIPRLQMPACSAMVSFCFTTRIWNRNLERTMKREFFDKDGSAGQPDVVVINSALWDLARYGRYDTKEDLLKEYGKHVAMLLDNFKTISKKKTWLVVLSTLPVSRHCSGAFITQEVASSTVEHLWEHIVLANELVREMVTERRTEGDLVMYLDIYTLCKNLSLEKWIEHDGTHWRPPAHRVYSSAILSAISRLFQQSVPKITEDQVKQLRASCDDLFRFQEYLKWLVYRTIKKTNRSLKDILDFIEQNRSGANTFEEARARLPMKSVQRAPRERTPSRQRPRSRSRDSPSRKPKKRKHSEENRRESSRQEEICPREPVPHPGRDYHYIPTFDDDLPVGADAEYIFTNNLSSQPLFGSGLVPSHSGPHSPANTAERSSLTHGGFQGSEQAPYSPSAAPPLLHTSNGISYSPRETAPRSPAPLLHTPGMPLLDMGPPHVSPLPVIQSLIPPSTPRYDYHVPAPPPPRPPPAVPPPPPAQPVPKLSLAERLLSAGARSAQPAVQQVPAMPIGSVYQQNGTAYSGEYGYGSQQDYYEYGYGNQQTGYAPAPYNAECPGYQYGTAQNWPPEYLGEDMDLE